MVAGYGLDGWSSIPGRGKFLIFFTASIPALGPTRHRIQWVPKAVFPGVTRLEHEADNSSHLLKRFRMVELYLHSPICLHDIVLN
jgi:hypothetical protein